MELIQQNDIAGDPRILRATLERSHQYCRDSFATHRIVLYAVWFGEGAVRMLFWRVPPFGTYEFWHEIIAREVAVQRRVN